MKPRFQVLHKQIESGGFLWTKEHKKKRIGGREQAVEFLRSIFQMSRLNECYLKQPTRDTKQELRKAV